MSGKLNIYKLGMGGVNLTKDPLHLSDDELTQSQNAEIVPDAGVGGDGALSKRGGLAALTTTLSGSVLGMVGLPVLTTYTRTLYVSRGTQNSSTFATTTDGTSYTTTTSPLAHSVQSDWSDENGSRDAHRMATFKNLIFYPGNNYTKSTDNPEIAVWDNVTAQLVSRIQVGPSGNGVAYAITDMIVAGGKIYFGVHDPGGVGANLAGRVMSYDPVTGKIVQVLNAFGNNTGDMTGGYPSALCMYQGQLWVGLNGSATTDAIGKVVRAYVDVDTIWTSDVANLTSHVSSLAVYSGDLYAGTQSSVSANAKVYKRSATAGTWAASFTSAAGAAGSAHCASLIVYGTNLYAIEYFSGVTDVVHIKKWDGSSWTTDRDVDSLDSLADPPQLPGNGILYGSDLYYVLRSTTDSGTDGFVLRLSGGVWTKVSTANYNGPMAVLVART